MISPFLAYNFSELIESHAVDTYSEFLETNEELLKSLPPTPQVKSQEKPLHLQSFIHNV